MNHEGPQKEGNIKANAFTDGLFWLIGRRQEQVDIARSPAINDEEAAQKAERKRDRAIAWLARVFSRDFKK